MSVSASKRRAAERVAYLRRLAKSAKKAGSAHEADTARRMAAKIVAEHELVDQEVDRADEDVERIDRLPFLRNFDKWQKRLALECANFCGGGLRLNIEGHIAVVAATGLPAQRHATVSMYAGLERKVFAQWVPSVREVFGSAYYTLKTRHEPDVWTRSFRAGVAEGIAETIAQKRFERAKPHPKAIIVRPVDFDDRYREAYPAQHVPPPPTPWNVEKPAPPKQWWEPQAPPPRPPRQAPPPSPVAPPVQPPVASPLGGAIPPPVAPALPPPPPPPPPPAPKGVAHEHIYGEAFHYGRKIGALIEVVDPNEMRPKRERAWR